MPGLSTSEPAIAAAFERHQPYQAGKKELEYLHALARVNKHSDFSEQSRTEGTQLKGGSGGGFIARAGRRVLSFGPGAVLAMGPGSKMSIGGSGPLVMQNITQTVIVGWNFVDPPVPVLPTLRSLVQETREAVEDVHHVAL